MRVSREVLLGIAGFVWLIAGLNIVFIGMNAYGEILASADVPLPALLVGSIATFVAFWAMFSRIVSKHTKRIADYGDEKQPFWRFFDAGSYAIMAFMMTLGISLRAFHLVPAWFIAFFYLGLGLALTLAGIAFLFNLLRMKGICAEKA